MKKIGLLFVFLSVLMLSGCNLLKSEKEFSGAGITVTLDKTFVEKEVIQAPLYLESTKHIFMGARESKSELATVGINTLEKYINGVLQAHGKQADVEEYDEDGVTYYYAYYTSEVNGDSFGYMLVVMEGENHFYSVNFGCRAKDLEKNKTQYTKWAKTITVE